MFFKEKAYSTSDDNARTTTTFNNIILETTAKELSSQAAIEEFMNIGGWKARRSGKELSFAKEYSIESYEKGVLSIRLIHQQTDWKEWVKTIGEINYLENGNVEIIYEGKPYLVTGEQS